MLISGRAGQQVRGAGLLAAECERLGALGLGQLGVAAEPGAKRNRASVRACSYQASHGLPG